MAAELTRGQALELVKAAAAAGQTPKRAHLDIVFGPAMAAEIAAQIAQRNAAEGRRIAAAVARRHGESHAPAAPRGESVEDLLAKIVKAMPAGEEQQVSESRESPQEPRTTLSPADAADEVFGTRDKQFIRTRNGPPGRVLGTAKIDGSQPVHTRGNEPAAEKGMG